MLAQNPPLLPLIGARVRFPDARAVPKADPNNCDLRVSRCKRIQPKHPNLPPPERCRCSYTRALPNRPRDRLRTLLLHHKRCVDQSSETEHILVIGSTNARLRAGRARIGESGHEGIRNSADGRNSSYPSAALPLNFAFAPNSSSMRSSWLYLAIRSVREAEPVLICPAAVATAKSAMNVSSVSPERCEMIELYP